jgi:hypothetical protein
MSDQTKRTLIWSFVSAIVCGVVSFIQFDLVYYLPGPVFGFLFSVVNLRKPLRIAIFVAASSVVYIIAWNLFFNIVDDQLARPSRDFAGFLAGLFGAMALALFTKFLAGMPIKVHDEARTVVLGAITGILFVELIIESMFRGFENAYFLYFAWPLAFAVWQVSIGWSLTTSIQKQFETQVMQSANP